MALAVVGVLVAVGASLLWPPNVYRYQGKTVEQWFDETRSDVLASNGWSNVNRELKAFQEMGTNAVSFLTSRINRDLGLTLWDRVAYNLPERWQPKLKMRGGMLTRKWRQHYCNHGSNLPKACSAKC